MLPPPPPKKENKSTVNTQDVLPPPPPKKKEESTLPPLDVTGAPLSSSSSRFQALGAAFEDPNKPYKAPEGVEFEMPDLNTNDAPNIPDGLTNEQIENIGEAFDFYAERSKLDDNELAKTEVELKKNVAALDSISTKMNDIVSDIDSFKKESVEGGFDELNVTSYLQNAKSEYNKLKEERDARIAELEIQRKNYSVDASILAARKFEAEKDDGSFLGATARALSEGVNSTVAGTYDFVGSTVGELMLLGEDEKSKEWARRDRELRKEAMKKGDWLKALDTLGWIPVVDVDMLGEDIEDKRWKFGTSDAYMQDLEGSTLGGAYVGVMKTLPALATPGQVGIFSQVYGSVGDEISANEELSELPEYQKNAIKGAVAMSGMLLERFGVKTITGEKTAVLGAMVKKAMVEGGEEGFENTLNSYLKEYARRTFNGTVGEFETGFLQQVSEDAIKDLAEYVTNTEGFNNAETLGQYFEKGVKSGVLEAIGGMYMAGTTSLTAAYKTAKIQELNANQIKAIDALANNPNAFSDYSKSIDAKVEANEITKKQGEELKSAFNETIEAYKTIPKDFSTDKKAEAFRLIAEKNKLQQEVEGKELSLVKDKIDRISEIDKALEKIPFKNDAETDAVNDAVVQENEVNTEREQLVENEQETTDGLPNAENQTAGQRVVSEDGTTEPGTETDGEGMGVEGGDKVEKESYEKFIGKVDEITENPDPIKMGFGDVANKNKPKTNNPLKLAIRAWSSTNRLLNDVQKETIEKLATKIGDKTNLKIRKFNESKNFAVRKAAGAFKNLYGEAVHTEESRKRKLRFKGDKTFANHYSKEYDKRLRDVIGNDVDMLHRVHRVLDPEIYENLESEKSKESEPSNANMLNAPEQKKLGTTAINKVNEGDASIVDEGSEKPKEFSYKDLSPREKQVYDILRNTNDFIHEWNYRNGFINKDTYEKFKGKYIARMYEEFEVGEPGFNELTKYHNQVMELKDIGDKVKAQYDKIMQKMFKARKDIEDVKNLTAVQDPIYLTTKRLAQVMRNKAILEYTDAVFSDPSITVSDNEFPHSHFLEPVKIERKQKQPKENVKKIETKAVATKEDNIEMLGTYSPYGKLTGKYVPNWVAEELRGFFFSEGIANAIYDLNKYYDRNEIRQFLKKYHTVYSPVVQLGNATSNIVFAQAAGVDPVLFTSKFALNLAKAQGKIWFNAGKGIDLNSEDYIKIIRYGLVDTDVITGDMVRNKSAEKILEEVKKDSSRVKKLLTKVKAGVNWVDEKSMESYQASDNIAKLTAFQILTKDYGYDDEYALDRVYKGFQNYAMVGKLYDFASKTPIIGNPYIKFKGDLIRILKNSFTTRPLNAIGYLSVLSALGRWISDEDDEEYEARTKRKFIPKIPMPGGNDIPLVFKVGDKEINLARYASPVFIYDTGDKTWYEELSDFAPYQLRSPAKNNNQEGILPRPNFGDLFLGTYAQLMEDKDFRDISIVDPRSSKYRSSGATTEEKLFNAINYIARSQVPLWSMIDDTRSAVESGEDYYGRSKSVSDVIISRLVKVQSYTPEIAQKNIEKTIKGYEYDFKQIQTEIRGIENLYKEDVERVLENENLSESKKESKIEKLKEESLKRISRKTQQAAEIQSELNDWLKYLEN